MNGLPRSEAVVLAATLAVLALIAVSVPFKPVTAAAPSSPSQEEFEPGLVLVKFKPLVPGFLAGAVLSIQGFASTGTINGIDVTKIAVPPGTEAQAIATLAASPLVEYAEPDCLVHALFVPNDALYGYQWNLRNVKMEPAWDITKGSKTITVAVIDSGLDVSHPDIPSDVILGPDYITGGNVSIDNEGHGTHVAGIIGMKTGNGLGLAGMAPGIRLMAVRVLDSVGKGTVANAAAAITWAADHDARVINLSFGRTTVSSFTEQGAINYALDKGAMIVAAAGNSYSEGNPIAHPAAYPGVLAVGASTHDDDRAYYSEVQDYVGVAAPGGSPVSGADPDLDHWILSTYPGGFTGMAGTSQAAPHAAALAGLVWSANPKLTRAQVTSIITSTAVDLGPPGKDSSFGWGRIDALAALTKAKLSLPALASTPGPTGTPSPTTAPVPTPSAIPPPVASGTPTPGAADTSFKVYMPALARNAPGW